jgi:hypothetical protein
MRHLTQIIIRPLLDLKFYYLTTIALSCFPTSDFPHTICSKHLVRAKFQGLPIWLMSQQTSFQNPNNPHQRQHHTQSLFLRAARQTHTDFALLQKWLLGEGTSWQRMLSTSQLPPGLWQSLLIQATETSPVHWRHLKEPASPCNQRCPWLCPFQHGHSTPPWPQCSVAHLAWGEGQMTERTQPLCQRQLCSQNSL